MTLKVTRTTLGKLPDMPAGTPSAAAGGGPDSVFWILPEFVTTHSEGPRRASAGQLGFDFCQCHASTMNSEREQVFMNMRTVFTANPWCNVLAQTEALLDTGTGTRSVSQTGLETRSGRKQQGTLSGPPRVRTGGRVWELPIRRVSDRFETRFSCRCLHRAFLLFASVLYTSPG